MPTAPCWAAWPCRSPTSCAARTSPSLRPHLDAGDFVVVINAEKVRVTGKKETDKEYMSYSGWKGGEKYRTVAQVRAKQPEKLIHHAVKGMIPKNRLGRAVADQAQGLQGRRSIRTPRTTPAVAQGRELTFNPQLHSMAETKTPEFLGTGRRKTAVARVRLAPGTGKITVNGRAV